jgi:hypothetical protein
LSSLEMGGLPGLRLEEAKGKAAKKVQFAWEHIVRWTFVCCPRARWPEGSSNFRSLNRRLDEWEFKRNPSLCGLRHLTSYCGLFGALKNSLREGDAAFFGDTLSRAYLGVLNLFDFFDFAVKKSFAVKKASSLCVGLFSKRETACIKWERVRYKKSELRRGEG